MESNVLQAENISKRYGDLVAVDQLSLSINEGEVLGLLGPNGAGKTTTINMLVGLLKPDSGSVLFHNRLLQEKGKGLSRSYVGVCPQEIVLWKKLTCLEQLVFMGQMYGVPARIARQRSLDLLTTLALIDKKDKSASTLSGGMQRRLNLAMSLVHDPQLLVLDEPEAGLDPQSRVLVREFIQSLTKHKTIIITTHNMDEADRVAQKVAIIDHGKLLVMDTPIALKANLGEGDVVEISSPAKIPEKRVLDQALKSVDKDMDITVGEKEIILRTRQVVKKLPALMSKLETLGVQIDDLHIRSTSLEDVFIQLTGRRLRE
jgi:ABC-2 type transport system ATP-binding protein